MTEPFKTYEIGGRKFALHELKLGQEQQLSRLLATAIGDRPESALESAAIWHGMHSRVLAIALTEEGVSLRDKNIDALAAFFEDELTGQQAAAMVEDFFGYIPITSVMEHMAAGLTGLGAVKPAIQEKQ